MMIMLTSHFRIQLTSISLIIFSIVFFAMTLSGCTTKKNENRFKHDVPEKTTDSNTHTTFITENNNVYKKNDTGENEDTKMNRCENQLKALKVVSSDDYKKQLKNFTHVMMMASQYGQVRAHTDPDTAAAVDALYQYRMSKMCAEISWHLLSALTEKGESR
ncbi:hypothetical protein [Pantoea stewartii]|uniref:hypothetical protein n=1 Tax=Pantoea stewartii TaxID=66269 RepID=UPI000A7001A4|nr:hypothetical protein [Pantoea stewartii]